MFTGRRRGSGDLAQTNAELDKSAMRRRRAKTVRLVVMIHATISC
jgi:hypothetical protein